MAVLKNIFIYQAFREPMAGCPNILGIFSTNGRAKHDKRVDEGEARAIRELGK